MNFLRNFLAALLALIVFTGTLVLLVIMAVSDEGLVTVNENSVVHIKLDLPVTEREMENPFEGLPVNPGPPSSIGLVEFREALEQAAEDDNIRGIFLELDGMNAGIASVEEIRNEILRFRESAKFVVTYARYYSEGAYYLASAADAVYMHPEGDVELNGLAATLTFFKGTFEKLEIEPQIFRVGEFKSAVEPLMRTDMSEENRLQMEAWINSVNEHILAGIGTSRGIHTDSLKQISDHYLVRTPGEALSYGLVDSLFYMDEVLADLSRRTETEEPSDLEMISYSKYRQSFISDNTSRNKIAVIVATGDIVTGEGDYGTIGSETFSSQIRKAREDDNVRAIVLRINSPGGSFIASDVIWREIALATEAKPVVASMGDAAASGGYYIAMACDTIVANPTTITGSIGIFSVLFNFKGFLNNKLGITTDGVATGEFSDMYSADRPVTERERRIIQNQLELSYDTFIAKGAAGRGMSEESLREIASGRIWTGAMAREIGLVDVLGDSRESVRIAAEMAGISDDYRVRYSPPKKSFLEMIFGSEEETRIRQQIMREEMGILYPYLDYIRKLERLKGVQARTLYDIEIN